MNKDKKLYTASHTLLKIVLGKYTNQHPKAIKFHKNTYGKPSVLSSSTKFNISHSKQIFVVAISKYEVGIDIEYTGNKFDLHDFISTALSYNERVYIKTLPETQQKKQFYAFWTRKEAFLKSLGIGLINNLQTLEIPIYKYNYTNNLYFKKYIISPLINFDDLYTGHISYQSTTEKCIQHKILNNDHIKQMVEELT